MEATDGAVILRVEGALSGPWVPELQAACEQVLTEARPITLDLGGVSFVDRSGAHLLQSLGREQAVTLANPPPFVREILREEAP